MWYEESVFYQIYPLGFCGAPFENDGICLRYGNCILRNLDFKVSFTLDELKEVLKDYRQKKGQN